MKQHERFQRTTLQLHDPYLDQVVDYMTKTTIRIPDWRIFGRFAGGTLRLHHFHQGEPEVDSFHDHEYDFYTFPFVTYREGVIDPTTGIVNQNTVWSWRWHFRPAGILHTVYGRWHWGNHGQGAINFYRSVWTVVVGLKKFTEFKVYRFTHPDGLTYDQYAAATDVDRFDPRPYWQVHVFDEARGDFTGEVYPLFPASV